MAFNSVFTLLIFILTLLSATATATTVPLQTSNLISAIVSARNFENWATILSSNPSILPLNFTLFLPIPTSKNTTFIPSHNKQNPLSTIYYNQDFPSLENPNNSSSFTKKTQELQSYLLLLYHIVPHRLSFADLHRYPVHTRLPTLLVDYTLLVTANKNQSRVSCSFSIDGSCVTRPELYQDETAFAHGIETAMNYEKTVMIMNKSSLWAVLRQEVEVFFGLFGRRGWEIDVDDDFERAREDF